MIKNYLGAQIRRLRNKRNWSQNEFAERLQRAGMENATRGKISKIEAGLVMVPDGDASFIARVLGVETSDLNEPSIRYAKNLYDAMKAYEALWNKNRERNRKKLPGGS